jgi:hypothetical protein
VSILRIVFHKLFVAAEISSHYPLFAGLLIERLLFTSETPNEALKHLYYNSPVLNPEKKEGVSNRTLDWNHKQVQESTPYQTSETNLQSQSVNVEYMKHIIHFILHCKLINHWVHLTEILANIETFSSTDSDGQFETHSNKQPSIDDVIHKTNLQMKLFEQVLTERTVVLRQGFHLTIHLALTPFAALVLTLKAFTLCGLFMAVD